MEEVKAGKANIMVATHNEATVHFALNKYEELHASVTCVSECTFMQNTRAWSQQGRWQYSVWSTTRNVRSHFSHTGLV